MITSQMCYVSRSNPPLARKLLFETLCRSKLTRGNDFVEIEVRGFRPHAARSDSDENVPERKNRHAKFQFLTLRHRIYPAGFDCSVRPAAVLRGICSDDSCPRQYSGYGD